MELVGILSVFLELQTTSLNCQVGSQQKEAGSWETMTVSHAKILQVTSGFLSVAKSIPRTRCFTHLPNGHQAMICESTYGNKKRGKHGLARDNATPNAGTQRFKPRHLQCSIPSPHRSLAHPMRFPVFFAQDTGLVLTNPNRPSTPLEVSTPQTLKRRRSIVFPQVGNRNTFSRF